MEQLDKMHCEACRIGAPTLTDEEIRALRTEVPDWAIVESDGIRKLQRVFPLENFAEALAFTDRVGRMAEVEGHHPTLLTEWGKTTVTWWSMKIKGLHRNDFIAAAKTDALYQAFDDAK
jgi:4a-hydroxytetrahydrobiopterin dehydratase